MPSATQKRPAMLSLDGRPLEAAWWGKAPGDAPTLVLLHEGLGSVELWRDFPARLAEATGLGVFAFSRFGYGASDPAPLPRPMTYMHEEAVDVLPRVLDLAGIECCALVGHSDGASIAIINGGEVGDERVRGLVLIAPHLFVENIAVASIAGMRDAYETGGLRERLSRYHRDVESAFRGWNGAWLDPRFRNFDITGSMARIRVPVLVLQGADDPYGTELQVHACQQGAAGPVETLMIEGAQHAPHVEATDSVVSAVASFAGRLFGTAL
ncbi:MAG: alpha/beta hydrolase [Acetobacteraceae bacterium]|nr:alpha/beta hydrolase [Acetobacteraceae bacterium]